MTIYINYDDVSIIMTHITICINYYILIIIIYINQGIYINHGDIY